MALVLNDRVKETSTTTGTGTLNLAGAETGFVTFVAGIATGNTTYYTIHNQGTAEWEVGIGTVTDATPDTLSRDTVLSNSSGNTSKIIKEAKRLTNKLFLPNYEYQKIGVILLDISDAKYEQFSFYEHENYERSDILMDSLDQLNDRFGNGTLFMGAQGIQKNWKMRADRKSAAYTTKLIDIPKVD